MVLELLLDVLGLLLKVLDLSWRSWTCPDVLLKDVFLFLCFMFLSVLKVSV